MNTAPKIDIVKPVTQPERIPVKRANVMQERPLFKSGVDMFIQDEIKTFEPNPNKHVSQDVIDRARDFVGRRTLGVAHKEAIEKLDITRDASRAVNKSLGINMTHENSQEVVSYLMAKNAHRRALETIESGNIPKIKTLVSAIVGDMVVRGKSEVALAYAEVL